MFALIQNNQIEVGPREWNVAFFAEYLIDNNLMSDLRLLSRQAPTVPIEGTGWRILPARVGTSPEFNPIFEQLIGPIWDIQANEIIGSYTKQDAPLHIVKNHLLDIVASNRYNKENTAIAYETNDMVVLLPTARDVRNTLLTGNAGTWKFKQQNTESITQPNGSVEVVNTIIGDVWLILDEQMLYRIQLRILEHVQECFEWEARISSIINNATTVQSLQNIDTTVTLSRD